MVRSFLPTNLVRSHVKDLPGHGSNDVVPRDYRSVIKDLANWVQSQAQYPSILVGYSMGGRIGWHLVHQYPKLFTFFIVESGSPGMIDKAERATRRANDHALLSQVLSGAEPFPQFLKKWYEQPIFASCQQRLLQRVMRKRMNNHPNLLHSSLQILGTGVLPSLWRELPTIQIPTLFLTGARDIKFCQMSKKCQSMASQITSRSIPRASHHIHQEQPQTMANAILEFINSKGNNAGLIQKTLMLRK